MKNLLLRIFLLAFLVAGIVHKSDAQIVGSSLSIQFTDALGNAYAPTPQVYIRNTDSGSFSNYPYLNLQVTNNYPGYYDDSCTWDSSFNDTMVTINYFACGQWFKLDTFFRIYYNYYWPNDTIYAAYLHLDITLPCIAPCDANFDVQKNGSAAYTSNTQSGHNIHHFWDFGDNSGTDTVHYAYHTYYNPGTYIIRHVINNDVSNCWDTAWDTVTFAPPCNTHFVTYHQGGATYSFNPYHNAFNPTHIWYMGDGTVHNNSSSYFTHTYLFPGTYVVKHVVVKQGFCADSTFDTLVVTQGSACNFAFSNVSKYNLTVTITPNISSMGLYYDFGDGNTYKGSGQVQHTYSSSGNYTIKMQDSGRACSAKTYNVYVYIPCGAAFTMSQVAPYTVSFSNTQTNNFGTSVYYFGDGDSAVGDTATHAYANQAGSYWVHRKIYDNSTGAILCSASEYFYINTCGNTLHNYNPDYINGQVIFDDTMRNDYDSLVVYLIYHDSANATLTLIDSTVVYGSQPYDSSYFFFDKVCYPSGTTFLVKAALLPGSSIYGNFLPTYWDSSLVWSGAGQVTAGSWIQINMRRGNNPGGPGFIGGYISQGANKNGAALDGIQVTLLRDDGAPVAYTHSANAGRYEFDNLAYGSYRVLVEIPGKPSQEYNITLDANNESFDDLDFEVNSTDITTTMVSVQNVVQDDKLTIYPNPADHSLFIEWEGSTAELSILDVNGKKCLQQEIHPNGDKQKIDVSSLAPGLYYIRLSDGQSLRNARITIH